MTLTLELPADLENRLRTNAALHGKPVTDYLVTLVENDPPVDLSEFRDIADFEDSVAELREGFADIEAGNTFSFDEVVAHNRVAREARRKKRGTLKPPSDLMAQTCTPCLSGGHGLKPEAKKSPPCRTRKN